MFSRFTQGSRSPRASQKVVVLGFDRTYPNEMGRLEQGRYFREYLKTKSAQG